MHNKIDQVWKQIIEIHNETKILYLLAEEICPSFKTFIQPNNELKHTLEHIIRSKALEVGIAEKNFDSNEAKIEYLVESYTKALGHEYRAFFDSADWISIHLRSEIINILTPYSTDCIVNVLPDYYSKDKKRIDEINKSIADIRTSKDIVKKGKLKEVQEYREILDELELIYGKIRDSIPILQDFKSKEQRKNISNKLWSIILIILTLLLGYIFGNIIPHKSKISTDKIEKQPSIQNPKTKLKIPEIKLNNEKANTK